jgi:hypothetical protein
MRASRFSRYSRKDMEERKTNMLAMPLLLLPLALPLAPMGK